MTCETSQSCRLTVPCGCSPKFCSLAFQQGNMAGTEQVSVNDTDPALPIICHILPLIKQSNHGHLVFEERFPVSHP